MFVYWTTSKQWQWIDHSSEEIIPVYRSFQHTNHSRSEQRLIHHKTAPSLNLFAIIISLLTIFSFKMNKLSTSSRFCKCMIPEFQPIFLSTFLSCTVSMWQLAYNDDLWSAICLAHEVLNKHLCETRVIRHTHCLYGQVQCLICVVAMATQQVLHRLKVGQQWMTVRVVCGTVMTWSEVLQLQRSTETLEQMCQLQRSTKTLEQMCLLQKSIETLNKSEAFPWNQSDVAHCHF